MAPTERRLDAEALRLYVGLAGLTLSPERAERVLPVATGLLAECDRLAALDLRASGGSGPPMPERAG